MWGRNWELCWGVGDVGSMGEVWKSVWGECGGCVEVGGRCVGMRRDVGKPTHSFTSLSTFSTLTRHLFRHSPNTSAVFRKNTT